MLIKSSCNMVIVNLITNAIDAMKFVTDRLRILRVKSEIGDGIYLYRSRIPAQASTQINRPHIRYIFYNGRMLATASALHGSVHLKERGLKGVRLINLIGLKVAALFMRGCSRWSWLPPRVCQQRRNNAVRGTLPAKKAKPGSGIAGGLFPPPAALATVREDGAGRRRLHRAPRGPRARARRKVRASTSCGSTIWFRQRQPSRSPGDSSHFL
jgi:hypothetical protein